MLEKNKQKDWNNSKDNSKSKDKENENKNEKNSDKNQKKVTSRSYLFFDSKVRKKISNPLRIRKEKHIKATRFFVEKMVNFLLKVPKISEIF